MEVSKIEAKLLKDEIAVFEAEVRKGLEIIRNSFVKYANNPVKKTSISGDFDKELNEYFASFPIARSSYYGGDYTYITNEVPKLPEKMKQSILDYAVKDFFEKLENIQDVVGSMDQ